MRNTDSHLVYVNMAEENGECQVQGVAMFWDSGSNQMFWDFGSIQMFWDFGSIQMFVTGVRTVSTQNTAGEHVKESSQRTSSRNGRNMSSSCSSKRTSSRIPTKCL